MVINNNISAMNANRILKVQDRGVSDTMEKLSSGMRINKAGDDASGLAVSEKMRAQIRGLQRASQNALDGISFIQTAEGYLGETGNVLQRMRELSIQASNGVYSDSDRMQIQVEVSQLVDEIDRIASHAQFNELNLLTGRFSYDTLGSNPTASMWIHIGANMDQRERLYIGTMTTRALGIRSAFSNTFLSISTPAGANAAIGVLDNALKKVNKQRADLGAYQTRFNYAIEGIDIGAQNLQASESRIRDANMAEEMSRLTKDQILSQTAMAMVSQANSRAQQVLSLLR